MSSEIGKSLIGLNSHRKWVIKIRDQSPYYPELLEGVERLDEAKIFYVSTILRVKHEGVWYTQHHIRNMINTALAGEVSDEKIKEDLRLFIRAQVYKHMMFGVIDPDMNDAWGEPLWPKDKIQQSEQDRLL